MKIKNNGCCDLKYAQELKKLGVKQDSLWYWVCETNNIYLENKNNLYSIHNDHLETSYSAFTVAELGELLVSGVCQRFRDKPKAGVDVSIGTDLAPIWYEGDKKYVLYLGGDEHYVKDDNEANARAKMLIYLIKEGLITTQAEKD